MIVRVGLVVLTLLGVAVSAAAAGRPIAVEAFDSGTRIVREAAEALTGYGRSILECYPRGSWLFLAAVSLLSERARISAIEWGMRLAVGVPAERAATVRVDELAQWCVDQYDNAEERFPAILLGAPNGAVAHLAALLRIPFLTTTFCLTFRHPTVDAEDVASHVDGTRKIAARIADANPEASYEIVGHVDPLHDRSLVRVVHFVRIKLHDLPGPYRGFIADRLAPGGTLILVDCTFIWPQYVLAERHYLQVGGLGAVEPAEYASRWPLELPTESRRESEWGCPVPFATAVTRFADRLDLRVLSLHYDHPSAYSLLVHGAFSACPGARSELLLIDSFNHLNPRTNVITGIPPLWLPFNTMDGVEFARSAIAVARPQQVFLAPLPSFADSPDTVSLAFWNEILAPLTHLDVVGTSPRQYPADPLAPYRLYHDLRALRRRYALDTPVRMAMDDFAEHVADWEAEFADPAESVSLLRELRLAPSRRLR